MSRIVWVFILIVLIALMSAGQRWLSAEKLQLERNRLAMLKELKAFETIHTKKEALLYEQKSLEGHPLKEEAQKALVSYFDKLRQTMRVTLQDAIEVEDHLISMSIAVDLDNTDAGNLSELFEIGMKNAMTEISTCRFDEGSLHLGLKLHMPYTGGEQ